MKRKHLVAVGAIIAILAFYCRRLERMAQCKLIFFVSSCGSVWINNVSSQKIKDS